MRELTHTEKGALMCVRQCSDILIHAYASAQKASGAEVAIACVATCVLFDILSAEKVLLELGIVASLVFSAA